MNAYQPDVPIAEGPMEAATQSDIATKKTSISLFPISRHAEMLQ